MSSVFEWRNQPSQILGAVKPHPMARANPRNSPTCLPTGTPGVARPVEQLTLEGEFVTRYDSLSSAARAVAVRYSAIHSAINGKTQTSAGHRWRYASARIDEAEVMRDRFGGAYSKAGGN